MTVDPAVAVVTVGVILLMGALIGASMSVKSWLRSIVLETIGPKIDLQAASVVVQSIPTGTTWTKLTPFDTNDSDSADSNPDQANDQIVIGRAGRYHVTFSRSLKSATANIIAYVAILKNGSPVVSSIREKEILALSKSIDSEVTDDITFAAGDVVTVGTYHNSASSVDLTYNQTSLSVHAID